MTFQQMNAELEALIIASYESGVTLPEAEQLAGRFLAAQLRVSEELRKADLDSRMKKTGVKSLRAAVYLEECGKTEKKPSDVLLGAIVDSSPAVSSEQSAFDEAEAAKDELERLYSIYQNAHIHFRTIAKGSLG
jgi:Lon protease-like protein